MNKTFLHEQRGVMLLEALIALLIFSVGVLSMVGLQAASISNSADATYRSEASYLAGQIIGQMWSDQTNLATYALNSAANPCTQAANITAGVNVNAVNWLNNDVFSHLPGSSALQQQIVVAAGNAVTVTVCWKPPKATSAHSFVVSTSIN